MDLYLIFLQFIEMHRICEKKSLQFARNIISVFLLFTSSSQIRMRSDKFNGYTSLKFVGIVLNTSLKFLSSGKSHHNLSRKFHHDLSFLFWDLYKIPFVSEKAYNDLGVYDQNDKKDITQKRYIYQNNSFQNIVQT